MMLNVDIKTKLSWQLAEIEERLTNVEDFKEWAILQNTKATILTALLKHEK